MFRVVVRLAVLAAALCALVRPLAAQCSFSISPSSASFNSGGGNGLITIAASSPACSRTATSNVPWITVSFGSPGTGAGTVGYTVNANNSMSSRSGTLTIAGQTFSVTQAGAICMFNLSAQSAIASPAGDTIDFSFTTSCNWSITTAANWITFNTPTNGTGDGMVELVAAANTTANARTATITVGNQTFTVSQGGSNCTAALNPSSASFPNAGGAGTFAFSTSCSWTAATTANWITITSPASGTADSTVSFTVAANTGGSSRTGTITVLGQTFTVTQAPLCTLTFSAPGASFGVSGGTGSVTVTASGTTCDRSATSDSSWITITSGQTGTGNGTVNFTVAANTGPDPRNGNILIGGQPFEIAQLPATCAYIISPTQATLPVGGGSGSFSITTSCSWTAASTASWIAVAPPGAGASNATVNYVVSANGSGQPRNASITIANQVFNIFQPGAVCDVSLLPTSVSAGAAGDSGDIQVVASPGCNWTSTPTAPWIGITFGQASSGEGTVGYKIAANTDPRARTGSITIANQIFKVTQAGYSCTTTLSANVLSVQASGGTGSVDVSAGCSWTAVPNVSWIQINAGGSGTTDGTVSFTVLANPNSITRTGTISVNGQVLTVTQVAAGCSVTLSSLAKDLPASGGTGTINVMGVNGCSWVPISSDSWLKVTWSSVAGSGNVTYSAMANTGQNPRTATITVAGQSANVTQAGLVVKFAAAGVSNAASFGGGSIAPGEIITIFGSGFGPTSVVGLQLSGDKKSVLTVAGGTRVLFDGVPAAMVYSVDGQLSTIVPYEVAGKVSTQVQVEYLGVLSDAVQLPVAAAAPALFTLNASGTGQGAILNQNNSVNGPANRATKGTVVILYATGEGQTIPAGVNGKISVAPLPKPQLPVTVQIGGANAQVNYAGAAPGLVAGVLQVNVLVPQQAPSGDAIPVVLKVGSVSSQSGVTLAIR